MGKLGAPTSKELSSPAALESEVRSIRTNGSAEESGSSDDELDFIQRDER
jgi:hypothetical protein